MKVRGLFVLGIADWKLGFEIDLKPNTPKQEVLSINNRCGIVNSNDWSPKYSRGR